MKLSQNSEIQITITFFFTLRWKERGEHMFIAKLGGLDFEIWQH